MNPRRKRLLLLLAGLVLIPTLLVVGMRQASSDNAAREKLEHLLGQAQPDGLGEGVLQDVQPQLPEASIPPEAQPPESPAPMFPDVGGGGFFGLPLPMPQAGVEVNETTDSYILRIPLADPEDAGSIKLHVTKNRIEVSGQSGSKEDGTTVTSSFMQAFTTSEEVLPGQVTRKTQQNGENTEMVITIPKKRGHSEDPLFPGGKDSEPQPDNTNDLPVDPNANPLDNIENKVI